MTTVITTIILFFIQALALKMAVAVMSDRTTDNAYPTAIKVSLGLIAGNFLLGLVLPGFISAFVYIGLWCAVVMKTYRFSLVKSICVAVLQFLTGKLLIWIVSKFFGLSALGCLG